MKHFIHSAAAIMSSFVCLVSCSEQESDLLSANQSSNSQLSIVTHTRGGETPIASVYLFNGSNTFVRTLQTDAAGYTSASASVKLPEGSYTLCALSPNDLSHFQIPEAPTPTSAITLAEGQAMSDLLIGTATATLADGANEVVDLELQRKVLEISSITISQVPDDVTGVTVSIAPLYSAVQFNGEYVATDPVTATFTLTSTATEGVWQVTPQQLVFPSNGVPTITVTFTRDNEDPSNYTYKTESAFAANNKYNIVGTYTEPLGVILSGGITLQPWVTDPTAVNFDFDETNTANNTNPDPNEGGDDPSSGTDESNTGGSDPTYPPVVGQTYKGCYVVSVDSETKTAVLLSPTDNSGYNTKSDWQTFLNEKLASWPPVEGVTGTWRIPTLTEIQALENVPAAFNISNNLNVNFFCLVDSELMAVQINKKETYVTIKSNPDDLKTEFGQGTHLQPVIDISY
jgi:hypothetical protein